MEHIQIQIKRFRPESSIPLPCYMTSQAAGMDLYADLMTDVVIGPGERVLIPTGVAVALPDGFEAQIRPRSGLALKHGITLINSPGTIDSDYRGEIGVILINHGNTSFVIRSGERVAQMVIAKYARALWEEVAELSDTIRGDGGFGHTGRL